MKKEAESRVIRWELRMGNDVISGIASGTPCTVNITGDIWMDYDARPFIEKPCIFLKITKAGLYQVALAEDTRKVYSFPKKNVDIAI